MIMWTMIQYQFQSMAQFQGMSAFIWLFYMYSFADKGVLLRVWNPLITKNKKTILKRSIKLA